MRRLLWLGLLVAGCAHGIKDLADCDRIAGEKRIQCGACVVQNKAEGWLGLYEFQPDNAEGQRCVRVK